MKVYLIGAGCGSAGSMTHEAAQKLAEADLIIGASRLLSGLPAAYAPRCRAEYKPDIIAGILAELETADPKTEKTVVVLLSGDSGFYSGAEQLTRTIGGMNGEEKPARYEVTILPGISSLQYFAAKLMRPWQDLRLVSAHGQACDAVREVMCGKDVFFLTGGKVTPAVIAEDLCRAGLGDLSMVVGENLSYGEPEEKIIRGTACDFRDRRFAPLSVALVAAAPVWEGPTTGIPDPLFVRGKVPMTKMEVRAVTLAKMQIRPEDVVWDVGAGTGSCSIEFAHLARRVYAVECLPEACDLIRRNREKFCAWNLEIIPGMAPEALKGLPAPTKVFIGGSRGNLEDVIGTVLSVNPGADICMNAITLETLQEAMRVLGMHGREADISQIAVSRAEVVGRTHMMKALNPVYVICG